MTHLGSARAVLARLLQRLARLVPHRLEVARGLSLVGSALRRELVRARDRGRKLRARVVALRRGGVGLRAALRGGLIQLRRRAAQLILGEPRGGFERRDLVAQR